MMKELDVLIDEAEYFLKTIDKKQYTQLRVAEFKASLEKIKINRKKTELVERKIRSIGLMYERLNQLEFPDFSFDVISDTHIEGVDESHFASANLIQALEDIEFLNPGARLVTNSGDLTDTGSSLEYEGYYNILKSFGHKDFINAIGNHDVRWLCAESDLNEPQGPFIPTCKLGTSPFKERFLAYNGPYMGEGWDGQSVYYDRWIDGYHFIVLNTEQDLEMHAHLSLAQIQWFEKTIAINAQSDKPIFVLLHQVMYGTDIQEDGDEIGKQDADVKAILSQYPQAMLLCGHVHSGIDLADVYKMDWGTQIDIPAFKWQAHGDRRNQMGFQVNVSGDRVSFRPRDFGNNSWVDEYAYTLCVQDSYIDFSDASDDVPQSAYEESCQKTHSSLFDNKLETPWISPADDITNNHAYVDLSLKQSCVIDGFRYHPRMDGRFGTLRKYEVFVSNDFGVSYTKKPHARGVVKISKRWKRVSFEAVEATNIRIVAKESYSDTNPVLSFAELRLISSKI